MADIKDKAARIVEALKGHPELHSELQRQLTDVDAPLAAYAVQCTEHEFGQRDDGWSLHASEENARAWVKIRMGSNPRSREQFWSYSSPYMVTVTREVWEALDGPGWISGRGNGGPPRGGNVTLGMLRLGTPSTKI